MFDHVYKISFHFHEKKHQMVFHAVKVVGHDLNFLERLFLEAWFSIKDPQSRNDHAIPEAYKCLARA